jgi:hypothetical protein
MALTIKFEKTGTNAEKAVVGTLTLLDGSAVVKRSTGFSGGNSFNPIDDGTYRIRLDIRGDEGSNHAYDDGTMKPFYGIQKVGREVPDDNGNLYDMQVEWGTIRARLNPPEGTPDKGDYLHGKQRPRDYTHGCVCERSETILSYLWNLASPPRGVAFAVSGGDQFDLESLVRKNSTINTRKHDTAPRRELTGRISELTAASGDGLQVRLEPSLATYTTTSDAVQMVLTSALAVNAKIELELFDGGDVIKRIPAFELFADPVRRPGTIQRLATQRNPDTGINWLEVFVADDKGRDVAYTVHDPPVQRLCHVVALSKRRLVFTEVDKEIMTVKAGFPA